jgi:hypothetical protein
VTYNGRSWIRKDSAKPPKTCDFSYGIEEHFSKNLKRHVITACPKVPIIVEGECSDFYEASNMNGQRCTLTLLSIAATSSLSMIN